MSIVLSTSLPETIQAKFDVSSEGRPSFVFFMKDKMKVPEISTQGVYDYVEAVDSGSSLSTPNSGNNEPFASEFLGETVIHLEKVHLISL